MHVDDDLNPEELEYLRETVDGCHGWSLEQAPADGRVGPHWRGLNLN